MQHGLTIIGYTCFYCDSNTEKSRLASTHTQRSASKARPELCTALIIELGAVAAPLEEPDEELPVSAATGSAH